MGTQSVTVTTSTPTTPPSWIKYYNMSSSSTLNIIRNITSTIWSIRTRHQASRVLRTTHLLLRCFLFFDICYLLSGISMLMVFLLMELGRSLYFDRAEWRHVFLLFAIVAVFSCWRHMHRQFLMMSLPRPEAVVMDVEGIMRELLVRENQANIVKDAPPKYEDLYIEPPQYDENTMNTEANNCDNNQ